MQRFLFFSFIILFTSTIIRAQKLEIYSEAGEVLTNQELTIEGAGEYGVLKAHLYVRNSSEEDLQVKVKKTLIDVAEGSTNMFCWGQSCYGPATMESPNANTILSQQTDSTFSGDYIQGQSVGISSIRYTFFIPDTEDDSVSVIVHFNPGTNGVNSIGNMAVRLYPNPVREKIQISTSNTIAGNVDFVLFDAKGTKLNLYQNKINGEGQIDLSSLSPGIYIYHIQQSGQVIKTGKIVKE